MRTNREAGGAEKVYANTQYEAAAAVAIDGCTDLVEAGGTCRRRGSRPQLRVPR